MHLYRFIKFPIVDTSFSINNWPWLFLPDNRSIYLIICFLYHKIFDIQPNFLLPTWTFVWGVFCASATMCVKLKRSEPLSLNDIEQLVDANNYCMKKFSQLRNEVNLVVMEIYDDKIKKTKCFKFLLRAGSNFSCAFYSLLSNCMQYTMISRTQ